jgi:hypothetical protein
LSLKWAIEEGNLRFLGIVKPAFKVETSQGPRKTFLELSTWELLNLKPLTLLEIPTRFNDEYSISSSLKFLQDAVKSTSSSLEGTRDSIKGTASSRAGSSSVLQSTIHGPRVWGGGKSLLSISALTYCRAPSVDNGCGLKAIKGIGSDSFIDIHVDEDARVCVKDLKRQLEKCLDQKIPVFGTVAIIGSTEHGACDPIAEMLKVRTEFQARGLSFAIRCDAAWSGYFTSMIREVPLMPGKPALPYVPPMPLQPYTVTQLESLCRAESITIDPHK